MSIDPVALAHVISAVSLIGNDYLKGVATEAGKASWAGIKDLFGWASDPPPADIPDKVASALTVSPESMAKLLELLKNNQTAPVTALVGKIDVRGDGKVVVADKIITSQFSM